MPGVGADSRVPERKTVQLIDDHIAGILIGGNDQISEHIEVSRSRSSAGGKDRRQESTAFCDLENCDTVVAAIRDEKAGILLPYFPVRRNQRG